MLGRRAFIEWLAGSWAAVTAAHALAPAPLPAAPLIPPETPLAAVPPDGSLWARTYSHRSYAMSIEISNDVLQDDVDGIYSTIGREMGRAAQKEREVELLSLFGG